MTTLYGGIEAGGTKIVCVVGSGPDDLRSQSRYPTTTPEETIPQLTRFFEDAVAAHGPIAALGIASFGPLELRNGSPSHGHITVTPKPGWSHTDMVGPFRTALGVPVEIDTDVNGAGLGEWRWGAAQGLSNFVYLTVGTGIGGGALIDGRPVHGLIHPEMGHLRVPRHPDDSFAGRCPYHGDCLEGLACGPAIEDRWGRPAHRLGDLADVAVDMEAHYLAAGIADLVYSIAPERVVLGGGVGKLPGLIPQVRRKAIDLLGGYPGLPEHANDDFIVGPALGDDAGVAGALALAERAASG
jgi:fructokinase